MDRPFSDFLVPRTPPTPSTISYLLFGTINKIGTSFHATKVYYNVKNVDPCIQIVFQSCCRYHTCMPFLYYTHACLFSRVSSQSSPPPSVLLPAMREMATGTGIPNDKSQPNSRSRIYLSLLYDAHILLGLLFFTPLFINGTTHQLRQCSRITFHNQPWLHTVLHNCYGLQPCR